MSLMFLIDLRTLKTLILQKGFCAFFNVFKSKATSLRSGILELQCIENVFDVFNVFNDFNWFKNIKNINPPKGFCF